MPQYTGRLTLLLIFAVGTLVACDSVAQASDSDSKSNNNADQVKALTLNQSQYVLGEVTVHISKDSLRLYNKQNDCTIMVNSRDGKVREFSIGRKIIFERTLDDFLSHGSSANWDYDENVLRMPWFRTTANTFLGRAANELICPMNPGAVRQLLSQGKKVDMEKHEQAH